MCVTEGLKVGWRSHSAVPLQNITIGSIIGAISFQQSTRSVQAVQNFLASIQQSRRQKSLAGSGIPTTRRDVIDKQQQDFDSRRQDDVKPRKKEGKPLSVVKVDLQKERNKWPHNTYAFEHGDFIVRRGQEFKVTITFDRPIDLEKDKVNIHLSHGVRPRVSKGSILVLPLKQEDTTFTDRWYAKYVSQTGNDVEIVITPSAAAIVGEYIMHVETVLEVAGERLMNRQKDPDYVTVLFNPWCKDDEVYLEPAAERWEYVMNETGRIWGGKRERFGGFPWNFGQFEEVSLDTALFLLELGGLSENARASLVHIIRCLSATVNSNDDYGVLVGRWGDYYPKGTTKPSAWTGSVAILEEYMRTRTPVKYGQCWVFSGLVTTLCRALGIPTRSVTNFSSGHDCDVSNTIDFHYDEDNNLIEGMNDSTWTFHVWNESWFKRRDLPEGFDGWQAHDATPQEESGGLARCGPASVKAIKEGLVYLPYDTSFIFSEVNGDRLNWNVDKDGNCTLDDITKWCIGYALSTKAIGSYQRHDLTADYKYDEGSEKEREIVRRAAFLGGARDWGIYKEPEKVIKFEVETPESVEVGSDFRVHVHLSNVNKDTEHDVKFRVTIVMAQYTGVISDRILSEAFTKHLKGGEEAAVAVHVSIDDYNHLLMQEPVVQVYVRGSVLGTKQFYSRQDNFLLTKPDITITGPSGAKVGEEFRLRLKFTNPLPEKLTSGAFHIEAPGIKSTTVRRKQAVLPLAEVEEEVKVTGTREGAKEIIVCFSSDQLSGMTGVHEIKFVKATEKPKEEKEDSTTEGEKEQKEGDNEDKLKEKEDQGEE